MARLRGTGLGAGMAMGTAAVVRTRSGVPLMPEAPPRIAALVAQRRLAEVPEVVVVAEDYRTARIIASTLSWAVVVAIAAERPDPEAAIPSIPVVTGLPGLMQAAVDDVLVLIDATRGIALIDPDPIYLAQYTAEHDRIAPKNRLYLDDAHLPAQTLDGRAISVVAITQTQGVEHALASGPDALYHALPLVFDPAELRRHLAEVAAIATGKPLIVPYNPAVPLTPLIEAVAYTDVTLAVAPPAGTVVASAQSIQQLGQELDLIQSECAEQDILCGMPRIAAEVGISLASEWPSDEEMGSLIEGVAAAGVTRLIFYGSTSDAHAVERLAQLAARASTNLIPLMIYISEATLPLTAPDADFARNLASGLQLLIGAGATGFLVAPEITQPAKDAIRSVSSAECRDELARWLAGA